MALEAGTLLARGHLPQPDRQVGVAGRQGPPVRRVRQASRKGRGGLDLPYVPGEQADFPAGGDVPEVDVALAVPSGEHSAVRGEGQGACSLPAGADVPYLLATGDLP